MSANTTLRSRFSLSMLLLAGLLAIIGLVLRGAFGNPSVDPRGFAQSAASVNFGAAWVLILLGSAVRLYGLMVLYVVLARSNGERLAWWGLLLSFAAEALFLSLTGFLAFAAPVAAKMYLQGNTQMLDVLNAGFFSGPVLSLLYPSGVIGTLGSILFGIAIWRSNGLPQWAGVLYALATPLLAFAPAFSYALELLGGLLLLVSGGWVAAVLWQQPAPEIAASSRSGVIN